MPEEFEIDGVSEEDGKKMCGNSWTLKAATAITRAALSC